MVSYMEQPIGKLIVIEGTDGSGKRTQIELLSKYCDWNEITHEVFDFPQYYKTFFGAWIGRYLRGDFGEVTQINPYLLTIPYAADRWQAKQEIERALSTHTLVLLNRYAPSNAVYQSAKLPKKKRQEFIDWEFDMEYDQFGIPKEELVIFLYVPYEISQKLIAQKAPQAYLGKDGKKDINETNETLMREVEKVYLEFCKKYPHWIKIECVEDGKILPKEEIHKKIIDVLKKKKYLATI
jgi:dTMP kinase